MKFQQTWVSRPVDLNIMPCPNGGPDLYTFRFHTFSLYFPNSWIWLTNELPQNWTALQLVNWSLLFRTVATAASCSPSDKAKWRHCCPDNSDHSNSNSEMKRFNRWSAKCLGLTTSFLVLLHLKWTVDDRHRLFSYCPLLHVFNGLGWNSEKQWHNKSCESHDSQLLWKRNFESW